MYDRVSDQLLSAEEVAEQLSCDVSTVKELFTAGKLKGFFLRIPAPAVVEERPVSPPTTRVASPYLSVKEAAAYLGISCSTFRKKARLIRRSPQTKKYRIEDLDNFAASVRPKRKR